MVNQYFKELAEYNLWANTIVCSWLEHINDEQWNKEIISSFNSIQETVLHIISAEKAWIERFKKNPQTVWIQSSFKGTKDEHIKLWKETSQEFKSIVDAFDENNLNTNLDFKRLNGDAFSMPYYQLFAHVVNHATYHRGQLVTMLRQAGLVKITATDLLGVYKR